MDVRVLVDEKMLEQRKKLLDGSEANERRIAKVLERWQRQQAQYQKYLDSLAGSK